MRLKQVLSVLALVGLLTGCDAVRDASDHAADSSKKVVYDMKERWRDLLTYHPREVAGTPLPQTRYCYRMQSDIVCYDSPQNGITAPLVGYQDGTSISWYQKGGGSTGFSGGPSTSVYAGQMLNQGSGKVLAVTAPSPDPGEIEVKSSPAPFKKQVK